MKKVCLAMLFLTIFVSPVLAHPPTKVEISFNASTRMLTAAITHPVENPENHYVGKVDVAINGNEVLEHKLSRQDNADTQVVSYLIPDAKTGDVISVEGYCNISGKKEEEIRIQ